MSRSGLLSPIQNLGALEGPVLAFGGPLSNDDALEALMAEADVLGVKPENMICTGDVAAYGAAPERVAHMLMDAGINVVMGNCEEALGADADDCGCAFAEGSTCDLLSATWYAYARNRIGARTREWMARLPRRIEFTLSGARFAVVHGGGAVINRYLFASDAKALEEEITALGADAVIAGHGGLPFTHLSGKRVWHNPGALGMPANDGTPRVWYGLITAADDGIVFCHRPLDYDFQAQAAKMRTARLPEAYAAALGTGLWPDNAILPDAETAHAGIPLDPESAVLTL